MRNLWILSVAFAGLLATNGWAADLAEPVSLGGAEVHPTRILAKFAEKAPAAARKATLEVQGLEVKRQYGLVPGLVMLDVNEEAGQGGKQVAVQEAGNEEDRKAERLQQRIRALRDSGLFEYVSADPVVRPTLTPNDARFQDGTLWGLRNTGQDGGTPGADINAVPAWDITTGSTDVIVAVIDTGVRYTHRDLASQMWRNPGEVPNNGVDDDNDGFVDNVHGINAIVDSGDPWDDIGHGTHVAGTIGAAANDGNPHIGVTWNVQLMALKFLGTGFGFTSDAVQCINFAVANGARILNNSWGGLSFSPAIRDAIVAARDQGVLFVASAGNSALNNDLLPSFPASYTVDNIISVAAIDRNDRLASFSNFGTNSVDVGAPGVEIFSSFNNSDSSYAFLDGTSMAAPHVSGVAALILGEFPQSTVQEMRERILATAVPVPALEDRIATGGRVDAFAALQASQDGDLEFSFTPPNGVLQLAGSTMSVFMSVRDLLPVNNGTVTRVTINGVTVNNVNFRNDGQAPDRVANDNVYSAFVNVPQNVNSMDLAVTVNAPTKNAGTGRVTYPVTPRPANDNFANAAKIPAGGGLVTGDNKFATLEAGEPNHAQVSEPSGSLWWNWSPNEDTQVLIDTSGSSFDTVAGVYTGSSVDKLTEIGSVDDTAGKPQGYFSFDAVRGNTYRIAVAGAVTNELGRIRLRVEPNGQADTNAPSVTVTDPLSGQVVSTNQIEIHGTAVDPVPNASGVREVLVKVNSAISSSARGTTNWNFITPPLQQGLNSIQVTAIDFAGNVSQTVNVTVDFRVVELGNDLFSEAVMLTGTNGIVSGNNTDATKEVGEPLHAGNNGGKSIWWRWKAPSSGTLFLSTTNSNFDTLLGLYTGRFVSGLTTLGGNDDAFQGTTHSELIKSVTGGETYHIAVDGFAGKSGTARLEYAFNPSSLFQLSVNQTEGGTVVPESGSFPLNASIQLEAIPDEGFDFVRWQGVSTSMRNPLTITIRSNVTLEAEFQPHVFADDFETGNLDRLPWQQEGAVPWSVQSEVVSAGEFAVSSGDLDDGETNTLRLTVETFAGTGAFDYRLSSEANWDFFEFILNGETVLKQSGEQDWLRYEFDLPAGDNTLEWRYAKDHTKTVGLDAVFVDNLDLPLVPEKSENTPAVLHPIQSPEGVLRIRVEGQTRQQYLIQASADLIHWETISTNVAEHGVIEFTDPNAIEHTFRFYRAITP